MSTSMTRPNVRSGTNRPRAPPGQPPATQPRPHPPSAATSPRLCAVPMTATSPPKGPLADLVVVEMGTLIAGPFCGQILGDFGAEVIKIEDPRNGDPMRQWGRTLPRGLSPWWPVIARNKKSVTLDLRTPEGQELARELIGKADVVIENFRPGALEKWGLGWAQLSAVN